MAIWMKLMALNKKPDQWNPTMAVYDTQARVSNV
jgi:hypothetical protein